jgi:hypothetical protein
MVKAVDIEGLIQKYMEKDSLERADALYLIFTIGQEEAAKTLRARYERSGAINSVLEDLNTIGIKDASSSIQTEDTHEYLSHVVSDFINRACVDKVIEAAKAKTLSQLAREILYIVSIMHPESIDTSSLKMSYQLLFGRLLSEKDLKKVLDELKGCYVIQYVSTYIHFPPYLDTLLRELQGIMPKVEVKISWPEGER